MDELRARVCVATRTVVLALDGTTAISTDAIAARAGVARTIVQQQFGSAAGVLEALFDHVTEHGCLSELPKALELADPIDTVAEVISIYARFWDAERELFRRLTGLAAFDRELRTALIKRAEHRQAGLRNLARRLAERGRQLSTESLELLCALTSFETLDALAGPERDLTQAVPIAQHMARAMLAGAR
jgi:AcrR family transcriptional regulator